MSALTEPFTLTSPAERFSQLGTQFVFWRQGFGASPESSCLVFRALPQDKIY